MMDNNNEEKTKQDVMVSNLPLLFADGNPTSISSMTAEDLQYFLPFLLKCILGCEPSGWAKHPRFNWWPADIPWSPIILTKKHQTPLWRNKLQNLVRRCYDYNGCLYLLHFSAKLQQLVGGFKYTDNWDGTTSMFDGKSGKLLVTFRNENMNYDKGFRQQSTNHRPMLLPRLSPGSPAKLLGITATLPAIELEVPTSAQMVEPLPMCDIYLCDYCGADFNTLPAIKAHETRCMAEKTLEAHTPTNLIEMDTKDMDQAKFMWYLSLSACNQTMPPANVTPAKVRPVVRKSSTLSDKRFTTIPFSSILAQSFFKKTGITASSAEALIGRYEKHCNAKPIAALSRPYLADVAQVSNRFRAMVAPSLKRVKEGWTHSYSFTKAHRRERMITIATGLNKRARDLVRQCRVARVEMERLKPEDIESWTRPKPKPPQSLLQPWVQKSIASLPASCTISLAPVDSPCWMRPNALPQIMMSRSEATKKPPCGGKQNQPSQRQQPALKPGTRPPPGLLPLITSAWSMQTMQTVKPTMNNHFTLPDVIPVPRSSKMRPPDPVIIQMSSVASPKVAGSSTILSKSRAMNADVIDLCSSDEEDLNPKQKAIVNSVLSKPLVLPPGISITKVKREPNGVRQPPSPANSQRTASVKFESNGTASFRPRLSEPNGKGGFSPPTLKLMGQPHRVIKQEPMIESVSSAALPLMSADSSIPIVTPLKLAKLPIEKREQMKQSLLKIQQKEGKSSSCSDLQAISEGDGVTGPDGDFVMSVTMTEISECSVDEATENEPIGKGPGDVNRRSTRKRTKSSGPCGEDESTSETPNKKPRRLVERSFVLRKERSSNDEEVDGESPTVIEVDVGGPDVDPRDASRCSSFGSLTPDSRNARKKSELSRLLEDECKELRRKGLEELPFDTHSNQRVTRCRTKSLPTATNKN